MVCCVITVLFSSPRSSFFFDLAFSLSWSTSLNNTFEEGLCVTKFQNACTYKHILVFPLLDWYLNWIENFRRTLFSQNFELCFLQGSTVATDTNLMLFAFLEPVSSFWKFQRFTLYPCGTRIYLRCHRGVFKLILISTLCIHLQLEEILLFLFSVISLWNSY